MAKEKEFIKECIQIYLGKDGFKNHPEQLSRMDLVQLEEQIEGLQLEGIFYELYLKGVFVGLDLPPSLAAQWKKIAARNMLVNSIHEKEVASLASRFNKKQIDYFAVKGIADKIRCDESMLADSSADMDFFIRKDDFIKVKETLISEGYEIPLDFYQGINAGQIGLGGFLGYENEIAFSKKGKPLDLLIDIQWDILNRDYTDIFHHLYQLKDIYHFEKKEQIVIDEVQVNVFPFELELVNIAFHYAFHHGFCGIKWLIGICLFLKKCQKEIDLEFLVQNVDYNTRKVLGVIFMLANDYLGREELSREQRKVFCIDRLLPFEFAFYKKMVLKIFDKGKSPKDLRIIKILLPYKKKDQWAVAVKNLRFKLGIHFKTIKTVNEGSA